MTDFVLFDVGWMLNQKVSTYDEAGRELPDDGTYQRHGAEVLYVFAEFLQEKGLLKPGVDVSRRSDLKVSFSQLTEEGQQFARFAFNKWVAATDRKGMKPIENAGLERYWRKFKPA